MSKGVGQRSYRLLKSGFRPRGEEAPRAASRKSHGLSPSLRQRGVQSLEPGPNAGTLLSGVPKVCTECILLAREESL